MASEPMSRTYGDLQYLEIQSFARGYHAYMDIWTPVIGQTLLLKREPTNPKDKNAVALYEDDYNRTRTVQLGTVPLEISGKRRKQGVRRGDGRKSKQESWIWAGDTLRVSSLWA